MPILGIDTSTRQIGVAVYNGRQILNEMTWTSPFHHTVELAPAVALSMERAGLPLSEIRAVGVAVGPGSFTALRSGLAFAKGFALANELPLIGIASLDVLANGQPTLDLPMLAVLEAGRTRLACGKYRLADSRWTPDGQAELLTAAEIPERLAEPTWICGELNQAAQELISENPLARLASPSQNVRRPGILAEMAWARWQAGDTDNPAELAPRYLSTQGIEG